MDCTVSAALQVVILSAVAALTATSIVMIRLLRKWLRAINTNHED